MTNSTSQIKQMLQKIRKKVYLLKIRRFNKQALLYMGLGNNKDGTAADALRADICRVKHHFGSV